MIAVSCANRQDAYTTFKSILCSTRNDNCFSAIQYLGKCYFQSDNIHYTPNYKRIYGYVPSVEKALKQIDQNSFLDYLYWKKRVCNQDEYFCESNPAFERILIGELIFHGQSTNPQTNIEALFDLLQMDFSCAALLKSTIIDYAYFHGLYNSNKAILDELIGTLPRYEKPCFPELGLKILKGDFRGLAEVLLRSGHYNVKKSGFYINHVDAQLIDLTIEAAFTAVYEMMQDCEFHLPEYYWGDFRLSVWQPYNDMYRDISEQLKYSTLGSKNTSLFRYRKGLCFFQKKKHNGLYYYTTSPGTDRMSEYNDRQDVLERFDPLAINDRDFIDVIVRAVESRCRYLAHYPHKLSVKYKQTYPGWVNEKRGERVQFAQKIIDKGMVSRVVNASIDQYVSEKNYVFAYEHEQMRLEDEKRQKELEKQKIAQEKLLAAQAAEMQKHIEEQAMRVDMRRLLLILAKNDVTLLPYDNLKGSSNLMNTRLTFSDSKLPLTRFSKSAHAYVEKLTNLSKLSSIDGRYNYVSYIRFLNENYLSDWFTLTNVCDNSEGYITWKALIREGYMTYPKNSSIAVILIFEMLNGCFISDRKKALYLMAHLWNHYYPNFQFGQDVILWIRDYWITSCPDVSDAEFRDLFKIYPCFVGDEVLEAAVRVEVPQYSPDYVTDFINANGDYRIKVGRLAELKQLDLLEACLQEAMSELTALFRKYNLDIFDYFGYSEVINVVHYRIPFRRAPIFEETLRRIKATFKQRRTGGNEICSFGYNDKKKAYTFKLNRKQVSYAKSRFFIEYIGKVTELFIRDWMGIDAEFIVDRAKLAEMFPNEIFKDNADVAIIELAIQIAVDKVCVEQGLQRSTNSVGNIDKLKKDKTSTIQNDEAFVSALQFKKLQLANIVDARNSLHKNQERLIIEDDIPMHHAASLGSMASSTASFIDSLNQAERRYLVGLLRGNDYSHYPDYESALIVGRINNAAIDFFGETIIDDTAQPILYDEYIEIINTLIQEQNI